MAIDPSGEDGEAIERAAAVIRRGGLVAFPTETVYGLGANACSAAAVEGIFLAKRRSPDDPCIVHIADRADLAQVAIIPSAVAGWVERLAAAFWPGPLSLILPRAAGIPDVVTARRPTVAVRMPRHPVALALIRAAGVPVAAPSANTFMHTSPTEARHVRDDLGGRIDLILDGGPTPLGVESTVLDLSGDAPTVLRPGGVSVEALRDAIGADVAVQDRARERGSEMGMGLPAPGLLERHYAPRGELVLLRGPHARVWQEMAMRARALLAAGRRVGVLATDEDARALAGAGLPGLVLARLGPEGDLDAVARRLYAGLRQLEASGVEVILARAIAGDGLGHAIRDRLRRAAGGHVITVEENPPEEVHP